MCLGDKTKPGESETVILKHWEAQSEKLGGQLGRWWPGELTGASWSPENGELECEITGDDGRTRRDGVYCANGKDNIFAVVFVACFTQRTTPTWRKNHAHCLATH